MECHICGCGDFYAWGRQGEYSIFQCRSCGLGVTSPFPVADTAEKINKETYNGEQRAAIYSAREKEFKKRYGGYLARIKRFKPEGSLLDVGCNIGLFMKAACQEGFAVTGIEMNASCAAYGKEKFGLDIHSSTLKTAAFRDGAFDVVTLFDVLEHIPDMGGFLAEVNRILKSGGLLVVQSPNLDSFMARLLKGNWSWLAPPDHLYHFTPRAMESILVANGLSVRDVRTWEPAADFSGNILSGFHARGLVGKMLKKVLWLAGIVLITFLQRLWWRIKRGGLLEIYAVKTGR